MLDWGKKILFIDHPNQGLFLIGLNLLLIFKNLDKNWRTKKYKIKLLLKPKKSKNYFNQKFKVQLLIS